MPHVRRIVVSLGTLLVIALVVERAFTLAHAAPTDFDDAYMYLRYAKHVLAGYGMAWNAGEGSVYGATSLLHLGAVTVAAVLFPRLSASGTLQVASGAAAFALLAGLIVLASLVCSDQRLRHKGLLWTGLLVPLVAFHDAFVFHAGTGMDTMLSALANTAVVLATACVADRPSPARAGWAALASLAAVLARPDNVLCALLCPTLAVLLSTSPRGRGLATLGGALLVGLASLVLSTTTVLGSPVPLSFFAKQPGYYGDFAGEYAWNPYLFLKVFFGTTWPFVAGLIVFGESRSWRLSVALLAPVLLTVVSLFRFNQIMGHMGRFYYPLLPFVAAAAVVAFDRWFARYGHAGTIWKWLCAKATLVRAATAVAVVVAVNVGLTQAAERFEARTPVQADEEPAGYSVADSAPLPEIDSWQAARAIAQLAAASPPGTSFAMSEHGLPGALAPDARIIDVLGLHDARFARHGFSADELFRRRPDVVWLPHPDHRAMVRAILASGEFWQHYDFYPDAFFYGLAVRRDGAGASLLAALVRQQWDALYPRCRASDYRAQPSLARDPSKPPNKT